MVPTLAVGFDDVRKRMESQYRQCAVFKERLEVCSLSFCYSGTPMFTMFQRQAINAKLEQIQRKHVLETMTRLAEHKRQHIDLTRRTIQVLHERA